MEQSETTQGNEAFGSYLKKVREGRRLSLDAVEELSAGFPEKVTKSHLSRIENGLALPSFPRLMAISHIYGVPIGSIAERFEVELRRGMKVVDLEGKTDVEVLADVDALIFSGDFSEALLRVWAVADRNPLPASIQDAVDLDSRALEARVRIVTCLIFLERYEFARRLGEDMLAIPGVPAETRLRVMHLLALANTRLQNYTIALLIIDECARASREPGARPRFEADALNLRGHLLTVTGLASEALSCYEEAIPIYESIGNIHEALNARVSLTASLIEAGEFDRARAELQEVLLRIESGTKDRLRAVALSNLALCEFRSRRYDESESAALKSNAIARPREYNAVIFRNCFYLWRIAQARHDETSQRLNERSLRTYLARVTDPLPEVDEYRRAVEGGA